MPLYEFECEDCKARFERIQKFTDANPEVCPTCGKGPIRRLLSSPAIQFKGSGFYITDYAKKSSSEAGSKSATEKSGGESKSDSKSGDSGSTSTSSSASSATPASTSTSTDSGSSSSSSDKKS
jgi:putative FmdB family regulatory protein